jgi:hypothetical protein
MVIHKKKKRCALAALRESYSLFGSGSAGLGLNEK